MTTTGGQPYSGRVRREKRTIDCMIRMYCTAHHHSETGTDRNAGDLCAQCSDLLAYSLRRIDNCSFGAGKPICARCPVHCFRPTMRDTVRAVMRYSGPRMTYRHPYLALRHLLDRREPGSRYG